MPLLKAASSARTKPPAEEVNLKYTSPESAPFFIAKTCKLAVSGAFHVKSVSVLSIDAEAIAVCIPNSDTVVYENSSIALFRL